MNDTPALESTEIITRRDITLTTWQLIQSIAPVVHSSRLAKGIASPEQAAIVMLMGAELGFNLTAAFSYIDMIEGKPALKPVGALALLHRSHLVDIKITDEPNACTVWMKRRDTGFEYSCRYTMDDAQKAGLVKSKGAWETYQANMLRARAIGFCARVVAPDVLAGLYLTSDLEQPTDEVWESEVLE